MCQAVFLKAGAKQENSCSKERSVSYSSFFTENAKERKENYLLDYAKSMYTNQKCLKLSVPCVINYEMTVLS